MGIMDSIAAQAEEHKKEEEEGQGKQGKQDGAKA
jgi:hypothetical protein